MVISLLYLVVKINCWYKIKEKRKRSNMHEEHKNLHGSEICIHPQTATRRKLYYKKREITIMTLELSQGTQPQRHPNLSLTKDKRRLQIPFYSILWHLIDGHLNVYI